METEGEAEPVSISAEHQRPDAGKEVVAADHAVAVFVHRKEDPTREVLTPEAKRPLKPGRVNERVRSRHLGEGAFEPPEELRINERGS